MKKQPVGPVGYTVTGRDSILCNALGLIHMGRGYVKIMGRNLNAHNRIATHCHWYIRNLIHWLHSFCPIGGNNELNI
jgi:hypothetical protein